MTAYLKLLKLKLLYWYYLTTFQPPILVTKTDRYHITPEAVRDLQITSKGITFQGCKYGMPLHFIVPMNTIQTIEVDEDDTAAYA